MINLITVSQHLFDHYLVTCIYRYDLSQFAPAPSSELPPVRIFVDRPPETPRLTGQPGATPKAAFVPRTDPSPPSLVRGGWGLVFLIDQWRVEPLTVRRTQALISLLLASAKSPCIGNTGLLPLIKLWVLHAHRLTDNSNRNARDKANETMSTDGNRHIDRRVMLIREKVAERVSFLSFHSAGSGSGSGSDSVSAVVAVEKMSVKGRALPLICCTCGDTTHAV